MGSASKKEDGHQIRTVTIQPHILAIAFTRTAIARMLRRPPSPLGSNASAPVVPQDHANIGHSESPQGEIPGAGNGVPPWSAGCPSPCRQGI
jgi:hypothetical protein